MTQGTPLVRLPAAGCRVEGRIAASAWASLWGTRRRPPQLATLAAFAVLLDRRTWHRAVGAKHAAITRLGFEPGAAAVAVIKELAGIGRHRFGGLVVASRTGNGRFQYHPADTSSQARSCL